MKFLRFCVVKILIFTFKVSKNPIFHQISFTLIVAIAKSLQSCLTLCDPIDSSPPGSPIPGILQARTLEWVAIACSNAWKWKVKVKSLSHVRLSNPMVSDNFTLVGHFTLFILQMIFYYLYFWSRMYFKASFAFFLNSRLIASMPFSF